MDRKMCPVPSSFRAKAVIYLGQSGNHEHKDSGSISRVPPVHMYYALCHSFLPILAMKPRDPTLMTKESTRYLPVRFHLIYRERDLKYTRKMSGDVQGRSVSCL